MRECMRGFTGRERVLLAIGDVLARIIDRLYPDGSFWTYWSDA